MTMSANRTLHLVQGGIRNGDKAWLERAAREHLRSSPNWVVPKSAAVGEGLVIYIGGYGFFATARIASPPRPRRDWPNRYGAALDEVRLIVPAISLSTIRRRIPQLSWAIYPRSITTPTCEVARRILSLIAHRRRTRMPDLSEDALETANIDELRRVALLRAVPSASARKSVRLYRARSQAIRLYVLRRADGTCESCRAVAPFRRGDGSPYLEPHHVARLADAGPDHPAKVIALCPNCHRRAHYAADAKTFNSGLIDTLRKIEARANTY
jgi:5-methylcytosine-specific restriction endonuclease McrA